MQGINRKYIPIVVLGAVIILVLSTQFHLFGNDWGTGLNIDTDTQYYEHKGFYNQKGKLYMYTNTNIEQLDSDRYIVAWQPGQDSVKINCEGHLKTRNYYYGPPATAPDFLVGQYAWVVQYEDTSGHFRTVINGIKDWYDTDYIHITAGQIQGNLANIIYQHFPYIYNNINPFGDDTWASLPGGPLNGVPGWTDWGDTTIPQITFQIKGQHVGAIRIYCVLEIAEINGIQGINAKWMPSTNLVTEDWAYLPSGDGEIRVLGTGNIGTEGTETTPETGKVYTKYVFEEGSTVHFEVDAMFSGTSLEPDQDGYNYGWELRIYKPGVNGPVFRKAIPDDVRNFPVEYTIPEGSFVPGGNNEWKVELWNTLFMQKETRLFVVDKLEKIPGPTTVQTDKTNYIQGDTVTITMTAYANPNGTGEISRFKVWAKYDSPTSTDYAMETRYVTATHVSGLLYKATTSFVLGKGDKYVYIMATAMDRDNRHGDVGTRQIFSEEVVGNYKVTIIVSETDGTRIDGAKVQLGKQIAYTNSNGEAVIWSQHGEYALTVSKLGYNTYYGTVIVNADKTVEVTLSRAWLPPESNWAFVLIIVAIILTGVYMGVSYYQKKYRHRH